MKSRIIYFFSPHNRLHGRKKDREKNEEMILYAEPRDGGSILSNI